MEKTTAMLISSWFKLGELFLLAIIMHPYKSEVGASKIDDLNGQNLIVAAEHWDPIFIISQESDQVFYSGFMEKVLDYLRRALNFTTTIVRPPDKSWGTPNSTGHWSGMVGQVQRKEADFGLGKDI